MSKDSPVVYRSSFPLIPILLGGVGGARAYSYGCGAVGIALGVLVGALTPIASILCFALAAIPIGAVLLAASRS